MTEPSIQLGVLNLSVLQNIIPFIIIRFATNIEIIHSYLQVHLSDKSINKKSQQLNPAIAITFLLTYVANRG